METEIIRTAGIRLLILLRFAQVSALIFRFSRIKRL